MSIPLYEKRNANSLSINGFPSTYTTDSQDDCSTVAVTPIARRKVMKHASGSYSPSYHHNLSLSLYEYDELKYFCPLIHDRCPPSIEKGNIMKYDLIGINKAFTYSIHHDVINGNIDGCREKVQAKSSCVNSQDTFGKTALHYAIETEASNIVTYLLESNCNLNIGDNNGVTALHTAVKVGNLSLVQILLAEESINVNCVDNQGMAPLHLAAVTNKELICSELLTANAIVFIEDDDHMTPVAYAAKNGYGDLLRMFFSHVKSKGWEVDELLYDCGSPKTTLLHLAVQGSSLPAVKLLLRNNANVSSKRDSDGNTPVHVAAACGSLAIIRCLIGNTEVENNASSKDESHENIKINLGVEVINSEGATPLHEAAKFGHDVIVKYLISCGIDVNDIDIKKKTPLMVAAESGSMTTVKLLLEQSADATILDRANKSCLHYSIGNYEIMKVILEHFLKEEKFKELVDAKDVTGSTALHYASKVGNSQEVLALLGAGANANSVNRFKETCFHVATCYGHLDILKILVKYQDEKTIDFMDDQDRTPLHVAAWNGYEDIISYLSSSNAHIKPDCDGRTPLHFAACNGHLKCLQFLVQRNVSAVNEADKQSETPLHIAAWSGHAKIVKYLLSLKKQMVTLNIRSQNPLDVAVVTKNEDVALAIIKHKRWRDFIYRTKTGNCTQIQILIARMPAAAKLLMDRCISIQGSPSQGNYKIIYEFEFLQGQPQSAEDGVKQSLQAFQTMVDYDRENCLVHPLSNALLKYKWDKYGWIAYLVNVLTFATFLTLLTYQIISNSIAYINDYPQMVECKNVTNLSLTNLHQSNLTTGLNRTLILRCSSCTGTETVLIIFCALILFKEMVQLFHQRLKYFDFTNMLEITLYISTFLYVIPCNEYKSSYQRNFGALAILAGWLDLILYVRRISFHGIYIIMISTMLITLFQVLILVVIFIFAFGCAFMVLYTKEVKTVFKSMADALFTTFLMMLGELTIDPNLSNLIKAHPVGVIVFIVFCLMMVIIIINLLVGLAVGDIDKIRQNAVYKRHIMQIDLLIELEGTLPASLLKRFYISRLEQFPSEESSRLSEIFTALSPFSAADQNLREIKSLHYLNESRLDLNLDEETASKGITINKNSNNGSLQQQSVATDIKENNGILRGVQSLIRRK